MLHPLFSTIIHRPDLVADHASAYAALIKHEAVIAGAEIIERGIAWAVAGVSALLFVIFLGVAFMLGFLMREFSWALVLVPGLALLVAVLAFFKARTPMTSQRFPELKAQIESDFHALRSVS